MKRFLSLCALAPGLLLLAGAQARADQSSAPEPTWTYSFSPGMKDGVVKADGGGGVSFLAEKAQTTTSWGTNVVLTNLNVFSSTPSTSQEYLSPNAGAYSIQMTLGSGGDTKTLTFTGNLSGYLNSQSATIGNVYSGQTTQQVTLGGYTFHVTLFDPKTGAPYYTPPNPPSSDKNGQTLQGSIGAYVSVDPPSNPTPSSPSAPEPSTLLLSCLGLSALASTRWRKGWQVSITLG